MPLNTEAADKVYPYYMVFWVHGYDAEHPFSFPTQVKAVNTTTGEEVIAVISSSSGSDLKSYRMNIEEYGQYEFYQDGVKMQWFTFSYDETTIGSTRTSTVNYNALRFFDDGQLYDVKYAEQGLKFQNLPNPPEKAGYLFNAWVKADGSNFSGYVSEAIDLYASWKQEITPVITLPDSILSHTDSSADILQEVSGQMHVSGIDGLTAADYKIQTAYNAGSQKVTATFALTADGGKKYALAAGSVTETTCSVLIHDYGTAWQSDKAYHWRECVCGDRIDTVRHGYGDWTVIKQATEREEGERERSCGACGYKETEVIPKTTHSHSYGVDWKADEAKHWHECGCGDRTDTDEHTYADWEEDRAATETEAGTKHRDCTVCGYRENGTIPATGGADGDSTGGTTGDQSGSGSTGDQTGGDPAAGGSGAGEDNAAGSAGADNAGVENGNMDADTGSGENSTKTDGAGGTDDSRLGNISAEVVTRSNVPAISLATSGEALASLLLTEEERQQADSGTDVRVVLYVEDASELVTAEGRAFVESALQSVMQEAAMSGNAVQNYVAGQYLDVSLYKLIGENRTQITETAGKIAVTIAIPDSLKAAGAGSDSVDGDIGNTENLNVVQTQTYAILRIHDGQAELLPDLDDNADTITIETDRFSIYVLVLSGQAANDGEGGTDAQGDGADAESGVRTDGSGEADGQTGMVRDAEPKTEDVTPVMLCATLAMVAGFTYLLLFFVDRKRGMTEETKRELVSGLIHWAKRGKNLRRLLALAVIFLLLAYYHGIGKRGAAAWEEVYGK